MPHSNLPGGQQIAGSVLRNRLIALAGLVALGGALVAYAVWPSGTSDTSLDKVRVGYLPVNLVGLPFFTARDQQIFAKHGIEVEPVRFESSPAIAAAATSGDIDFATTLAFSVAVTTELRDPGLLKVFLVDAATPEANLSAMVTRPDTGIRNVDDLRGKKVASFPGPTALTFFARVLEKHGLDAKKDVQIVELPAGLHIQALMSGQVDALNTYEPVATQARLENNAVVFFQGPVEAEVINPWQAGVNAVTRRFARERPDVVRRLIAAMNEAVDFQRQHPEAAKTSLVGLAAIPDHVARELRVIPVTKIGEVDVLTLQRHADILYESKLIDRKVDVRDMFVGQDVLPAVGGRE